MEWFAVDIDRALAAEFLEIPPDVRGHFFALLALAHRQGHGGLIPGCRLWTRRAWDRAAGLTIRNVESVVEAGLARWLSNQGTTLEVSGYDHQGEKKMRARSDQARKAAFRRWGKDAQALLPHCESNASAMPTSCAGNAQTDRQTDPRAHARDPRGTVPPPPPDLPPEVAPGTNGRVGHAAAEVLTQMLLERQRIS